MESRKAHILENGGSNPSPAINSVRITLSVYRWSMVRLNLSHEKKVIAYPDGCCVVQKATFTTSERPALLVRYQGTNHLGI